MAVVEMRFCSNQLCLEDNTERSESNLGRSLGIYKAGGTAVWKTVPTRAGFTCSSLRDDHKCSKSITDNALMSLATKIMFWCKKWLEYLDKPMSISIFAPTNIFTARRQQILDTLWKWENTENGQSALLMEGIRRLGIIKITNPKKQTST